MDGDGFHADDPLRFAGIGAVIPLGSDGFTLNPEYTKSATRPSVSIGAPRVSGAFERLALRTAYPLIRAHDHTLTMTGGLSFIRQSQRARDFSVDLDKDQYSVASVGIEDSYTFSSGTLLTSGLTLSHGLGGRGQPEALFSGVPLSRQGAGPVFTKLTGAVHLSQPLPQEFWLDIVALGQSSFGKPLPSPEQFALDGSNAVSAFAAGSFSVDQGATLRAEIRRPFVVSRFGIAPYVFAAAGRGEIVEPTAVEQSIVAAQSVGLGVRTQVDPLRTGAGEEAITLPGFSIGFEAGRQFSNLPGLQHGWRAGLDVSAKF
jgi:hemolysin activation/secretion protein